MKADLEKRLVERWPKWFKVNGNIQHTLMPFGFACGDGWFDILWRLCEDLEKLVGDNFEVIQVKEKFGGLCFYTEGSTQDWDAVNARVNQAEAESYKTCEVCGKSGKPRGGGWITTLCDECAAAKNIIG